MHRPMSMSMHSGRRRTLPNTLPLDVSRGAKVQQNAISVYNNTCHIQGRGLDHCYPIKPSPTRLETSIRFFSSRPNQATRESVNNEANTSMRDSADKVDAIHAKPDPPADQIVKREASASSKPPPTQQAVSGPTTIARAQAATGKFIRSIPATIGNGVKAVGSFIAQAIRDPKFLAEKWDALVKLTKEVAHHYWTGSKLLWIDIKTTYNIVGRVLQGSSLTRRERKQLIKTGADVFRLVPFAIFVIVPFMELLLPVALKLWPNMLPSTFQDKLKKEEDMKRELKMRLALAGFLQDTLQEIARHKKTVAANDEQQATAQELVDFIDRAKHGEMIRTEEIGRAHV